MMIKNYQRLHLRAPYKEDVLFADEDYVFKARTLNISEGGMLLDQLPTFPSDDQVPIMFTLPQYPYFKNFNLLKMRTFAKEMFPKKVVRAKCRMVRRIGMTTQVDDVFKSRIGLKFTLLDSFAQKQVGDYVSVFASNLIYLQMLIDSYNTDEDVKLRVRALADLLGYTDITKVALLRHQVNHDYKSLQWL